MPERPELRSTIWMNPRLPSDDEITVAIYKEMYDPNAFTRRESGSDGPAMFYEDEDTLKEWFSYMQEPRQWQAHPGDTSMPELTRRMKGVHRQLEQFLQRRRQDEPEDREG